MSEYFLLALYLITAIFVFSRNIHRVVTYEHQIRLWKLILHSRNFCVPSNNHYLRMLGITGYRLEIIRGEENPQLSRSSYLAKKVSDMFKYTVSKKVLDDVYHSRGRYVSWMVSKKDFYSSMNWSWSYSSVFRRYLQEFNVEVPYEFRPRFVHLFTFYSPTRLRTVPLNGYLIPVKFFDEKEIE